MLPILLALTFFADPHLHGIVRDSVDGVALQGATVRVVGSRLGAITDAAGEFHLHDVVGDSVTLEVSMIGYAVKRQRVPTEGSIVVTVLLSRSDVETRPVDVTSAASSVNAFPTQPTRVMSAEEIDAQRAATLAATLERTPGVTSVTTGPGIAKPMIHGMTGTRLVMTNAGIAQEGQQWGQEHGPEIDPFVPARITILKGPAGVRLGPNAMGGAISIEPLPLSTQTASLRGEAGMNIFTNNGQGALGAWLETSRPLDTDVALRAQASLRKAATARTPNYTLGNTGFDAWSAGASMVVGNDTLGVTVHGTMFSTTLGIYDGAHMGNPTDLERAIARGAPETSAPFSYDVDPPRQEVAHRLLSVQGHWQLGDVGRLKMTYGWQQNDRSEFDAHNTRIVGRGDDPVERARDSVARLERALQTPAMNLLLTTYNGAVEMEQSWLGGMDGAVGVTGLRQVNDRAGSVYLVPDYEAYGVGLYAFESWSVDRWIFSGGLRVDRRWLTAWLKGRGDTTTTVDEREWGAISASMGMQWMILDSWNVLVNAGLSWRPPQVNELYANDVHHGAARYEVGDPELDRERALGIDVTSRHAVRGFEAEATLHLTHFDKYIQAVPDAENPTVTVRGTFPTYQFVQTDAVIVGVDLSSTLDLSDIISLYVNGSMVRGTDLGRNVPLFLMPADRLRVGAHLHLHDVLDIHDVHVDLSLLGVRTQDRYVVDEDYAPPPPGYVIADLSVGGRVSIAGRDARLSISIRNVLDRPYRDYLSQYRYFADDPGRDIILRFTIPFGDL